MEDRYKPNPVTPSAAFSHIASALSHFGCKTYAYTHAHASHEHAKSISRESEEMVDVREHPSFFEKMS